MTLGDPPVPYPMDRLTADAAAGTVQDVVVALPDLQGRLQGLRVDARHFCAEVARDGVGACVYLLAVDQDMVTGPGYALDAAGLGFGDVLLRPDLGTLRLLPWDEGTALVLADPVWPDPPAGGAPGRLAGTPGEPVAVAPRQVLRGQLDRLAGRGLTALAGIELEFLLFEQDPAAAHTAGYRGLRPASRHNTDYALTGLERLDPVVRRIRRELRAAGLRIESSRGECHPGQYEIVFRYADALEACDGAVLHRTGTRQIAGQEGAAVTFMAKYDEGEGSSGHVHLSLRDADDAPAFAEGDAMSPLMRRFLAGQLACLREFALLFAPTVNSWTRLQPGAFAPTTVSWGPDNRLCALRVVGSGRSLRFEHRVPGADVNPYLAVAGILAAGLHGVEQELDPGPACAGPPGPELPRLPASLDEAVRLWEGSAAAVAAFGQDVVRHLARAAHAELEAHARAVTDWELRRGFERP